MLNTYIAQALEISKNNYEQVNANLSNNKNLNNSTLVEKTSFFTNEISRSNELNKPAPEIAYITPVSGPETGGNFFAIRGKNFVEGTTVTIGGKPLQNIKIPQSFLLQGQVPAGELGKVDVVVTNPDGQSCIKKGGYEYVPPKAAKPEITGITPASGPETGGNIIDIEGKNFVDGLKVRFSTQDNNVISRILGEVTFVNSTLVRVKVPAGKGRAGVTLANPDGQLSIIECGYIYE